MALNSHPLMLGVAPEERRLCAVLIARAEETFHHFWRIRPYRSLLKTAGLSLLRSCLSYRLVPDGGSRGDAESRVRLCWGGGMTAPGPEIPAGNQLPNRVSPASAEAPSLCGLLSPSPRCSSRRARSAPAVAALASSGVGTGEPVWRGLGLSLRRSVGIRCSVQWVVVFWP